MDEAAIKNDIGLRNGADRAKIVGSLMVLRGKAAGLTST